MVYILDCYCYNFFIRKYIIFKICYTGLFNFRLTFNIWLIIPMISIKQEVDANSTFDNTIEWKNSHLMEQDYYILVILNHLLNNILIALGNFLLIH